MADKIAKNRFSDIEFGQAIGVTDEGTINFSRAHSAAPTTVIAVNGYNSDRFVSPYDMTSSGFKVFVKSTSWQPASSWINWVAIWGG